MKNSKIALLFLCIFLLISLSKLCSQPIGEGEFMIINNTDETNGWEIKVDIYPYYAIFNGNDEYTFKAANEISLQNDKIWGIEKKSILYQTDQNYTKANFDKTPERTNCDFSLGYGLYRIDFYEFNGEEWVYRNGCFLDFSDANFTGTSQTYYFQKLVMNYYNDNSIYFHYIETSEKLFKNV